MKSGKTIVELAEEVNRQSQAKVDLSVQTRAMAMVSDDKGSTLMTDAGSYSVLDLTHNQVGSHLGIPNTFYNFLKGSFPNLLDTNVNTLFAARQPEEVRLLRTLDGNARAFLSNRYRRLDNEELLAFIIPELLQIPDLQIASSEVTDTRLYLKLTTPRVQMEVTKGDVVQAGVMISNSEVGLGQVSVVPFSTRLTCLNGAVHTDFGMNKKHVGRAFGMDGGEAEILFADDTKRADDEAFFLKVRDVTREAMNPSTFAQIVSRMRDAAETPLPTTPIKTVEVLARKYALRQNESEGVLIHLLTSGDLSKWGVANAFTRQAADVESYDRATTLETYGGDIIDLKATEWKVIGNS